MLLNTLQSQLMLSVDRMKEQENENDKLCEELQATKMVLFAISVTSMYSSPLPVSLQTLEEIKHKNVQKKEDSSQKVSERV